MKTKGLDIAGSEGADTLICEKGRPQIRMTQDRLFFYIAVSRGGYWEYWADRDSIHRYTKWSKHFNNARLYDTEIAAKTELMAMLLSEDF